jgi:ATP-dependent RNA helicase RhlE
MTFRTLGLAPALAHAATAAGWARPTPVQAAMLPAALQGRDMCVQSPTGSGKTAAFLLPLLQRLITTQASARPRRLRGLVLAPTREIALQTADVARTLLQGLPAAPKLVVAVGGASINPQLLALRGGTDLLVATPGRLLDLLAHNGLHLDDVATLVLDEADRLLDLGFADELARVLAALPARRQTLLVSATLPDAVRTLAAQVLHDPVQVDTAAGPDAAAPPAITQRAIVVDSARRTALLRHLVTTSRLAPGAGVRGHAIRQRACGRQAAPRRPAGRGPARPAKPGPPGRRAGCLCSRPPAGAGGHRPGRPRHRPARPGRGGAA